MRDKTYAAVMAELHRARTKHPAWPVDDVIHAAAIVAEESGELIRAALHVRYEKGSLEDANAEAVQTIVTCIRFLEEQ